MKATPHPRFDRILAAVRLLLPQTRPFRAVCHRCVETSFAHEIVSGEGARRHGGRWNAIGSFRAVYLSSSPEVALAEFLARARRMRWPDHKSLPMVMAGVEVRVRGVLDLRLPAVTTALERFLKADKLHRRTVQSRREAISQAIGRAVRGAGFQGLIAPSQQVPEGTNIVLFPDTFGRRDRFSAPKLKVFLSGNSS